MGAKINNFQGFFAQKLKLHFLDRPSFNINSTFPCAEFRSSGSLIPLKDHVAEKGVSDLFQYTQKRVRKLYSCALDRVTAQVRKLAMERETTPCAAQPAGRSARPATVGFMFHSFPPQRH